MTQDEFNQRWLTLSYNRLKNQGIDVEFPPESKGMIRKAYGRNGLGRHSMFCFSNSYHIETWKNGNCFSCDIDLSHGERPFKIYNVKHSGLQKEDEIILKNGIKLRIYIIDSNKTAKKSVYHGIAFWVGKRLVGEPFWELGNRMIRDGRTQIAKRYTVVVQTEDMYEDVLPDWTSFKDNDRTNEVFEEVAKYVDNYIREISKEKRQETKLEIDFIKTR